MLIRSLHEVPADQLQATFESNFVSRSVSNWQDQVVRRINDSGIATFSGVASTAEYLDLVRPFGEVRVHAQTDGQGVTTLATSDTYQINDGVVQTPYWNEQLFHTDGSKMTDPPGAVAIYCERPDPTIQRVNVFARAKSLYEALVAEDPDLLHLLRAPFNFGDFKSPIFYSQADGLIGVRFRQAPEPPKMGIPDEIRLVIDARLRQPDIMMGVTLAAGQGVIFNNYLMLHGLGRSFGIGRVAKRVQLSLWPNSPVKKGFEP
jgi:hypothetical protein